MAPRPRKHVVAGGSNSSGRQTEATGKITEQWLADLLKYKVFGESKPQPDRETVKHLAHYLGCAANIHKSRRPIAVRDEAALGAQQAISFLLDTLPGFRADADAGRQALLGWEKFGPVTAADKAKRESLLSASAADIEKLDEAISALSDLHMLDVLQIYGVSSHYNWHEYAYQIALVFIDLMAGSQGALELSNTGPVARFVWHIIPSISRETVTTEGTVGRFLSRERAKLSKA